MKRLILAIAVLVIIGSGTMWLLNRDSEHDSSIIKKIQLASKVKKIKLVAESGDVGAQYQMGGYYERGEGVPPSPSQSAFWYKKAAEQGHVPAQFNLGKAYEKGSGIKQDFFAASKWYRLAASFGKHPEAQFNLGQMYFYGRGVDHDYGKAIKFYKQAAGKGHPVAQHILGAMYEEGWGVTQDYITAYAWYKLASPKAAETMAFSRSYNTVNSLKKLKKKMNRYQIEEAEKIILKKIR